MSLSSLPCSVQNNKTLIINNYNNKNKSNENNILNIVLTAFILLFSACSDKNADLTPPVITLHSPAEGAVLKIGDEHGVHFDMTLEDDIMLSSYRINIHSNFDGHEHNDKKTAGRQQAPAKAFSFDKEWDVSGKRNTNIHHYEIVIPADAAPGNYHLMVFCFDAAGNESKAARNIVLSNEAGGEHHHH